MHTLVVTFWVLLAGHGDPALQAAPDAAPVTPDKPMSNPLDLFTGDERTSKKEQRDRCLTAAGAGIAGALIGGAVLGAPAYIVGTLSNVGADGKLIGEPNFAYKRYFVPGFTLAGAFIGGALATVGTYYLVDTSDERPGVMR